MKKLLVLCLAALTPVLAQSGQTITDIVANTRNFSTLLTAVKTAGLGDTLAGRGPFTVFAPTNDAFAKVPKATLDALLADKAKLTKVLTYHVVSGNVKAADVVKLSSAKTVEGSEVKITVNAGKVKVNDANVTQTDIAATNGTIHVIDAVILPPNL